MCQFISHLHDISSWRLTRRDTYGSPTTCALSYSHLYDVPPWLSTRRDIPTTLCPTGLGVYRHAYHLYSHLHDILSWWITRRDFWDPWCPPVVLFVLVQNILVSLKQPFSILFTVRLFCSVCQNLDIKNDIAFLLKLTPQALVSLDRSVPWLQLCKSLRKHRLWRNANSALTCLPKLTATWNAAPER